ncbi:type II toxin-antitoxin system HicB family antitoxin [Candidatus Gottesmanbacteria bacterium]|nr:type II toxin-antitoxin system HicB family antitoxin [Candidatus Gottesmanbacteria bacterium]
MKVLQFKVLIEQDKDGWYVASVPELPGCYTQGKTLEVTRTRIKEVIELVLDADPAARKEKLRSPSATPRFFGVEDIQLSYA